MSEAEAKVYSVLLSRPSMTIQEVTNGTKLPRSTVLLALEKFSRTGVIDEYMHGKRRNFVLRSPQMIENFVDEQAKELEAQRANLANLVGDIKKSHFLSFASGSQIEILRGEEGFKDLFNRILRLKKGEEVLHLGVESEKFFFYPEFLKWYVSEKNKRGIRSRLLLPDSALGTSVKFKEKQAKDLRETRFLSKKLYNPDCTISIWGECVSFTTWNENLEIVIMESRVAVDILRSMFEVLWQNAKK